ncbi:MAG: protoheme IX farnesyltransferase [Deltaproteobacteria bacterium]|nr:protoheme IX farnesyltransferase [Deltaproteobacteria bacterium]
MKISLLVSLSAFTGYVLNEGEVEPVRAFIIFMLVFISSCGASILNQAIERHEDSLMERTRTRLFASSILSHRLGYIIGCLLCGISAFMLGHFSTTASVLSLITCFLYNFVYTPLKKKTVWALIVGTLPGSLPVLGGALCASPVVTDPAFLLFLIVAFWQIPHFTALSVFFKDDYEKAGFKIGFNEKNKKFFLIWVILSGLVLIWLNFQLLILNRNFISFFLVSLTLLSSLIASAHLIFTLSKEASCNAVKNLSLFLTVLLVTVIVG